jgi:AraC-like DNA-binding protein
MGCAGLLFSMLFRSDVPRGPVGEFVTDFWLYEGYEGERPRELILPSGTFEMVFNLQEDELRIYSPTEPHQGHRFAGALVSGPYSGSFMSDASEERAILGVHFKPGGAAPLLGIPAGELRDLHVDLTQIWGPPARTLHERLAALRDPSQRFELLEHALLQRLDTSPNGHGAVRVALNVLMRTQGRAKTRDIASTVGLSQRHLIELFESRVGLTPKLFGRVRRFLNVVRQSQGGTTTDWAQLATECGYFDQSHLIRDFSAFAGVSPAEYRRQAEHLDRAGIHRKRHHLPLAA